MQELDVRILPPPAKHSTIHARLNELSSGDTLRIVNDHDPRPLRYELESDHPGNFTWTYVESGPQTWRVDILKTGDFPAALALDMLADTQALSVSRLAMKKGESNDIAHLGGTTALILCDGEGQVEVSGRTHPVRAGSVELICSGEPCKVAASTDLHAYVVIAKGAR